MILILLLLLEIAIVCIGLAQLKLMMLPFSSARLSFVLRHVDGSQRLGLSPVTDFADIVKSFLGIWKFRKLDEASRFCLTVMYYADVVADRCWPFSASLSLWHFAEVGLPEMTRNVTDQKF